MSMAKFDHGVSGAGVISKGSGCEFWLRVWQSTHFSTISLTVASMFKYPTFSRSKLFVFSMPWCPTWDTYVAAFCKDFGITILVPFKMMFCDVLRVSSLAHLRNGWMSLSLLSQLPLSHDFNESWTLNGFLFNFVDCHWLWNGIVNNKRFQCHWRRLRQSLLRRWFLSSTYRMSANIIWFVRTSFLFK